MGALAGVALAGPGAAPAAAQPAPLQGLDGYIERALEDWTVPGLAVAVVRGDSVLHAAGYGVRDVRTGEPVTPRTVFAIGSAGKAFTAAVLGAMVDDGLLRWDDPLVEHVPSFRLPDPYAARETSIRDALAQRTGLGSGPSNLLWYGGLAEREEIVRRLHLLPRSHGLRQRFQYNNMPFLVAAAAAEAVSGRSWDHLVARRIFEPLGMSRSSTSIAALAGLEDVAAPHVRTDEGLVAIPYRDLDAAGPAGSVNSSALDLARWIRMHLGGGSLGGRRVLSDSVVAEITSPQTPLHLPAMSSVEVLAEAGAGSGLYFYGLGWAMLDHGGRKLVWHPGNIDGMGAAVAFVPDARVGVAVLINTNQAAILQAVMMRVLDRLLGLPEKDWSAALLRIQPPPAPVPAATARGEWPPLADAGEPPLPRAAYAGVYADPLMGTLVVEATSEGLVARLGDERGLRGPMAHVRGHTFRIRWEDRGMAATFGGAATPLVTFRLDAAGDVAAARLTSFGGFVRCPRPRSERSPCPT